ncbi:uncharacterized protein ACHE_60090A [Aspergillus chevalieri]|uniref:Neutral protease 2 n=1 Tax=Aspergillus chevalieri TaxID=182096 RepID=A0A7R7VU92_ASPCH|nr:uncharacterized protein ACHE_60090A [Aspergillus chevalieri]BCR90204.1 hypothetical protein ACHE_60090A [Aspergillus chevalieri]
MSYSSNEPTIEIDAKEAKTAIVDTVLANTVKLAGAAADTTNSGEAAQSIYYFKITAPEAHESIRSSPRRSQRSWFYQRQHQLLLHRPVAREEQLQGELPRLRVGSAQHDCELWTILYVVEDGLPAVCEGQDETTTALHGFTHFPALYEPLTSDFKYGDEVLLLESEQALENADNYAMYVTAVYLNCNLAA